MNWFLVISLIFWRAQVRFCSALEGLEFGREGSLTPLRLSVLGDFLTTRLSSKDDLEEPEREGEHNETGDENASENGDSGFLEVQI